jgi:lipoate-protein ligase A
MITTALAPWKIVSTPPMSGAANMAYDLEMLRKVQYGGHPPILRFFRWSWPTVSYGKHQRLEHIGSHVPPGWDTAQRPTGGGLVFHEHDLCLSLCWRAGQPPLPARLKDHYAWIHNVLLDALQPGAETRLATCRDCAVSAPFAVRDCFSEPVAFDVLQNDRKIAGGALCRQKDAFLYQGSLQNIADPDLEPRLAAAFQRRFLQDA